MVESTNGTCYEDAWRYLIKEEEGELIHGTVESLGRRIGHAWVELPTGYIWDPQTKSYFSIKDFDIAASPVEEHRYTVEEAAIMLSRVGKHGPWTKEEKKQFLKRGNPAFKVGDKVLVTIAGQDIPGWVVNTKTTKDHFIRYIVRIGPDKYYEASYGQLRRAEGNPVPEKVPAVPEVTNFMEEWKAVVPDDVVATFSIDPRTDIVDINSFYVTSKVKGVGSLAMQKMVDLADKYGITLRGIPSPKQTQFREAMTKDQLIRYYERFGFKVEVVNGVESIVREPMIKPLAVEVAKPKRYIIKEEPEPLYKSGKKYVAYYEDGTPRYLAAETEQALKTRLLEAEPSAEFVSPPAEDILDLTKGGMIEIPLDANGKAIPRESEGGNPGKELITKEEAIGLLERLSMTPGEAARSLVADEAERREIMRTVQQRVKKEQNKFAPFDPREGPPLPRIFAGLRWPWKKD